MTSKDRAALFRFFPGVANTSRTSLPVLQTGDQYFLGFLENIAVEIRACPVIEYPFQVHGFLADVPGFEPVLDVYAFTQVPGNALAGFGCDELGSEHFEVDATFALPVFRKVTVRAEFPGRLRIRN